MDFDQVRLHTAQLQKIAHKFGVTHIYVFGSVARGEQTTGSDIDLLVEMQEGASLFGAAGFGYETEQLLGVQVDVVPLSVLSRGGDGQFLTNIRREAVPL
jgi:uncharacterized protein